MNSPYYKSLAKKIPASIRERDLLSPQDLINNAVASPQDPYVKKLAKIWYMFIEPNGDLDMGCGKCLSNVISNFKELLPELKALKQEEELLNQL